MTRVFITGATGFAGSHLADSLLAEGHKLFALVHRLSGHQALPDHPNLIPMEGDLTDLAGIKQAFQEARPDVVYHLGGMASPSQSWENASKTFAINVGGTANVLEAAVSTGLPRVVAVTSAQLYSSLKPEQLPINEQTPTSPSHPYAISKIAAGMLIRIFWQKYHLPVIEARPFNHIGPHQSLGFVVPDFASQLAKIAAGQIPPVVEVGNLDAERDFTDVRDITAAYRLLAEKGIPGEPYLICSGKSVAIRSILDMLIEIAAVDVTIQKDPARYRPLETKRIYGDYGKINRDTGWEPTINLSRSLNDAYREWKEKLDHDSR